MNTPEFRRVTRSSTKPSHTTPKSVTVEVKTTNSTRGRPKKSTPQNVSYTFKTDTPSQKLVIVLGDMLQKHLKSPEVCVDKSFRRRKNKTENGSDLEGDGSTFKLVHSDDSDSSCSSTDSAKIELLRKKAEKLNDTLTLLRKRKEMKKLGRVSTSHTSFSGSDGIPAEDSRCVTEPTVSSTPKETFGRRGSERPKLTDQRKSQIVAESEKIVDDSFNNKVLERCSPSLIDAAKISSSQEDALRSCRPNDNSEDRSRVMEPTVSSIPKGTPVKRGRGRPRLTEQRNSCQKIKKTVNDSLINKEVDHGSPSLVDAAEVSSSQNDVLGRCRPNDADSDLIKESLDNISSNFNDKAEKIRVDDNVPSTGIAGERNQFISDCMSVLDHRLLVNDNEHVNDNELNRQMAGAIEPRVNLQEMGIPRASFTNYRNNSETKENDEGKILTPKDICSPKSNRHKESNINNNCLSEAHNNENNDKSYYIPTCTPLNSQDIFNDLKDSSDTPRKILNTNQTIEHPEADSQSRNLFDDEELIPSTAWEAALELVEPITKELQGGKISVSEDEVVAAMASLEGISADWPVERLLASQDDLMHVERGLSQSKSKDYTPMKKLKWKAKFRRCNLSSESSELDHLQASIPNEENLSLVIETDSSITSKMNDNKKSGAETGLNISCIESSNNTDSKNEKKNEVSERNNGPTAGTVSVNCSSDKEVVFSNKKQLKIDSLFHKKIKEKELQPANETCSSKTSISPLKNHLKSKCYSQEGSVEFDTSVANQSDFTTSKLNEVNPQVLQGISDNENDFEAKVNTTKRNMAKNPCGDSSSENGTATHCEAAEAAPTDQSKKITCENHVIGNALSDNESSDMDDSYSDKSEKECNLVNGAKQTKNNMQQHTDFLGSNANCAISCDNMVESDSSSDEEIVSLKTVQEKRKQVSKKASSLESLESECEINEIDKVNTTKRNMAESPCRDSSSENGTATHCKAAEAAPTDQSKKITYENHVLRNALSDNESSNMDDSYSDKSEKECNLVNGAKQTKNNMQQHTDFLGSNANCAISCDKMLESDSSSDVEIASLKTVQEKRKQDSKKTSSLESLESECEINDITLSKSVITSEDSDSSSEDYILKRPLKDRADSLSVGKKSLLVDSTSANTNISLPASIDRVRYGKKFNKSGCKILGRNKDGSGENFFNDSDSSETNFVFNTTSTHGFLSEPELNDNTTTRVDSCKTDEYSADSDNLSSSSDEGEASNVNTTPKVIHHIDIVSENSDSEDEKFQKPCNGATELMTNNSKSAESSDDDSDDSGAEIDTFLERQKLSGTIMELPSEAQFLKNTCQEAFANHDEDSDGSLSKDSNKIQGVNSKNTRGDSSDDSDVETQMDLVRRIINTKKAGEGEMSAAKETDNSSEEETEISRIRRLIEAKSKNFRDIDEVGNSTSEDSDDDVSINNDLVNNQRIIETKTANKEAGKDVLQTSDSESEVESSPISTKTEKIISDCGSSQRSNKKHPRSQIILKTAEPKKRTICYISPDDSSSFDEQCPSTNNSIPLVVSKVDSNEDFYSTEVKEESSLDISIKQSLESDSVSLRDSNLETKEEVKDDEVFSTKEEADESALWVSLSQNFESVAENTNFLYNGHTRFSSQNEIGTKAGFCQKSSLSPDSSIVKRRKKEKRERGKDNEEILKTVSLNKSNATPIKKKTSVKEVESLKKKSRISQHVDTEDPSDEIKSMDELMDEENVVSSKKKSRKSKHADTENLSEAITPANKFTDDGKVFNSKKKSRISKHADKEDPEKIKPIDEFMGEEKVASSKKKIRRSKHAETEDPSEELKPIDNLMDEGKAANSKKKSRMSKNADTENLSEATTPSNNLTGDGKSVHSNKKSRRSELADTEDPSEEITPIDELMDEGKVVISKKKSRVSKQADRENLSGAITPVNNFTDDGKVASSKKKSRRSKLDDTEEPSEGITPIDELINEGKVVNSKKKSRISKRADAEGTDNRKTLSDNASQVSEIISHLPSHFLQDLSAVKPLSSKRKSDTKQSKKQDKKRRKIAKDNSFLNNEDFIPLNSTGSTKFGAMTLNGVGGAGREFNVANFKKDMMFGKRVRRTPVKTQQIVRMKQNAGF